MFESLSLSDILGYASIGCWLGAQFPQVVENINLQSCEGLALPFLANWLLGDISNLVGCVLTHQLPFQKWLATYFVCVDFMLVAQYFYYYKPPKGPPSVLGHIRAATSPAAIRRMSVDRGASRYRALSAAASNVAAAAALAAQQDEQDGLRRPSARHSTRTGRRHGYDESSGSTSLVREEEDQEENIPAGMLDSFHSEGGRDYPKRVSWSIERHRGRAASVGQPIRSATPTALHILSDEHVTNPDGLHHHSHRDSDPLLDSTESLSPIVSSRGSRASRKGSTMVFLGAWMLFGIGTLAGQRSMPSSSTTNIGRVLSRNNHQVGNPIPIALNNHDTLSTRDLDSDEYDLDFAALNSDMEYGLPEEPHEDPSSEQILGRIFAWLCTTLYLTSRLPQIWKNYVRKSVEGLSMYLFVFAFLGNCFYVSSILASPRRLLPPPESSQFLRESIPYLLGSGGTLMFDITIVAQSFCYKPRHKRHASAHVRVLDEEEAGLLSGDALSAHPDSAITNRGRTSRTRGVA
ncbi:PQ loop repeat-domain-containing protein [Flammula alnicola]|nr:PQ loop repeat-domain-containing protein [Flammula alnicola]